VEAYTKGMFYLLPMTFKMTVNRKILVMHNTRDIFCLATVEANPKLFHSLSRTIVSQLASYRSKSLTI